MRKALIAIIAFVAVGLGFWIFIEVMDPTPIVPAKSEDSPDIEVAQSQSSPQSIGDTTPEVVEQMRYFKYDPITKEPVAEYGFERMLNPGQGRTRWEVEKPYIIFYRPDYQCRIDSEVGVFQVDAAGSSGVPKEAQLDKNVVIHITPAPDSQMGETFIYMDDLIFSSARSEFTTDGPVRVNSAQIEMDGLGLVLIFNTAVGRIEYLNLRDLDYLRLKNISSTQKTSTAKASDSDAAAPVARQTTADSNKTSGESDETDIIPQVDPKPDYYLCTIEDNVEIQYGQELIVSGADQVNIQNIDFSGMDKEDSDSDAAAKPETTSKNAGSEKQTSPDKAVASAVEPAATTATEASDDSSRDVVVKCDGGIIIQPMPARSTVDMLNAESDLALEMSGTPLRIDRIVPVLPRECQTLAHCGLLKYKPAEDILRLFTSPLQPEILLNSEESNSWIQTSGNVFWDRKAQHANIAGPGKVTIGNAEKPNAQPSEINFQGMMDLLFAQMPQDSSSATIQTINLTGGMDAILRQNGTLKTKSDSAVLEFGQENMISEARLDGDVQFESLDKGKTSRAESDSAVFHFAENQIAQADLAGDVSFASADGQFASSEAVIEFQPDASGAMQPAALRTTGKAVMQTTSLTAQPPAKFEAQKIDYDLETGSGLAYGPIRVTYYQQPKDAACLDDWVPLTITADSDTRFFADKNRMIKRVVFNENVIASRLVKMPTFTERDLLHGDKLVVDFDKDAAGENGVSKIAITEGDVYAQSKKTHNEETLFNMKLDCNRIDYDGIAEKIIAGGPGKIELDNSKAQVTESDSTGMSFKKPCVARVKNFNLLQWDLPSQTLIADGNEDTMTIEYGSLIGRLVDRKMYGGSMWFKMEFVTDSNGKTDLSRVYTDKGIYFEETPGHILVGQTMEYDALNDGGWLTITGTPTVPCFIDKQRVPSIRYNVNTGELDTTLSTTPGMFSN